MNVLIMVFAYDLLAFNCRGLYVLPLLLKSSTSKISVSSSGGVRMRTL